MSRHPLPLDDLRDRLRPTGRTWHRHERGAGKFMRTIELPDAIDSEKVDAEYRNGVLLITLSKPQSKQPKRISVRSN